MKPLNRSNLPNETHPVLIVQFGGGAFMRGFVDFVIHRMNQEHNFQAGVVVVKPTDRKAESLINRQQGLFHLTRRWQEEGQAKEETELISCLQGEVNAYEDFNAFLALAEQSELKLVFSNTTEAGISYVEEPYPRQKPAEGFPGKLCQLLFHRFSHFKEKSGKGLLVVPCELIEDNGKKLKELVLRHAEAWGLPSAFIDWVLDECSFADTLVDRIVVGTPSDVEVHWAKIGYRDELLTISENYLLWAIQGDKSLRHHFPADGAGLGVVFTPDLQQYRSRKVLVLNGAHLAMCFMGLLSGIKTVREAALDPELGGFIKSYLHQVVLPGLQGDKKELEEYVEAVWARFLNASIVHELASVAQNTSAKFQARIGPVIAHYVKNEESIPEQLAAITAAMIRFYAPDSAEKVSKLKDSPTVVERFAQEWTKYHAGQQGLESLVSTLLADATIWGRNLAAISGFPQQVSEGLKKYLIS